MTVRVLPGVEQGERPARPLHAFSFHRRLAMVGEERRWHWSVSLHAEPRPELGVAGGASQEDLSASWVGHQGIGYADTKDEARTLAKAYAAERGIAYAEWIPPPPPTDGERAHADACAGAHRIRLWDADAERHEDVIEEGKAKDRPFLHPYFDAAQSWLRAARACEEQVQLQPGLARHLAECAASRLRRAEAVLDLWHDKLLATAPTDGLRLVPVEPPAPEKES